jgi:heterodisulfide reductase subunit A
MLGGRLRELSNLSVSNLRASELLEQKLAEVKGIKSNLTIMKGTELKDVKGSIGNFELTVCQNGTNQNLNVGAVIIATGADVYRPEGDFGYGKFSHVMTNLELEQNLKSSKPLQFSFKRPKKAVYILCVGSRTLKEGVGQNNSSMGETSRLSNPGCSRICCDVGIKQSLKLQERGIDTTVLYRDIRTFDKGSEEVYYQASSEGIKFIRYDSSKPPELTKDGRKVKIHDSLSQEVLELDADLVILGCGLIPGQDDVKLIQSLFKIPKGMDGFFLEAHPKLAPLETTTGGIYLAGTAQYPKSIHEALTQGSGAALKAAVLLSQDSLVTEPITAIVDSSICWGCGTCVDLCIYSAPSLKESDKGQGPVSYINPTLCKGCGACAARCPSGAINANLFTAEQLIAMINAMEDEL